MKKLIFLGWTLSIILSIGTRTYAQTETNVSGAIEESQNAISFSPQYTIVNGIRIDYERRLKNKDTWLVFAPVLYTDTDNNDFFYSSDSYAAYETMSGIGFYMYFKKIVYKSEKVNTNSDFPRLSIYFAAGPNYQHFNLNNSEEVAVPFVENGITYYEFELQDVKKPINRFGGGINIGGQIVFDRFLIDIYTGVAVKYSYGKGGKIIKPRYSDWLSLDYSGILLNGGIRFGMFF